MEFQNYTAHQSDWISFLLIAVVFAYGLLHFIGAYQIKSAFSLLFSRDTTREQYSPMLKIILNANTLTVLGLFIYEGIEYFNPSLEMNYLVFLRIVFGIMVLVGLQKLIILLHSGITSTVDFFKNYLATQNQFAHLASVVTIPLLILSIYSNTLNQFFLFAWATVFGGIYLFGILKSIALSNRIKGPLKLHLIFYLCGNEILPFFLFYKILI